VHARAWQKAFGWSVRIVFVSNATAARAETADVLSFHQWAVREAGLDLAMTDVFACTGESFPAAFASATGTSTDLVVCPGSADCSTELGTISLRGLWHRAAQHGAALLVARQALAPRRILVATDGTSRTLPVLKLAFELGEHLDAQLSYFDSLRIPLHRILAAKLAGGPASLQRVAAAPSTGGQYLRAVFGLAGAMARAGKGVRADLVLVGVSPRDHATADDLFAALPCSVLAVPCAPPGSTAYR